MYTLHHLLKLGFRQSAINYHGNKGMLNHVKRIRPGGDRVYTVDDIIRLGRELNIAITEERIQEVCNEQ